MWVLYLPRDSRHHEGRSSLPGGYVGEWERVTVKGVAHSGTHVPDDHPAAGVLRGCIPSIRDMSVAEDAGVEADGKSAASRTSPASSTSGEDELIRSRLVELAIRNAWETADLVGTWSTSTEDRGLRSPVTGLTLLEMAQCSRPGDWPTVRERGEAPWASSSWRDPFEGWAAPAWHKAPKRPVVEDGPVVLAADLPVMMADDERPTEMFDTTLSDPDDPTMISIEGSAPIDTGADFDLVSTIEYPEVQTGAARMALQSLALQNGKAPSLNRANLHLGKHRLPKVPNLETLQWLLKPE